MLLALQARIKDALRSAIQSQWGIEPPDPVLNQTPKVEMGDLATPVCLELSRKLKKTPRAIAEELIKAANTAMYRVKERGKDGVFLAIDPGCV